MLRILVWITRKIAKGCGAFMGQSERLYAGKHPIPPLHPMLWTVVDITLGGGGRGGGSPPPPIRKPCPGHDAKPGRFFMGNVS